MSHSKFIIAGTAVLISIVLTFISSWITSPFQTYPNGVAYPGDTGSAGCSSINLPGSACYAVHSIDYGFPRHAMKINDGIYYPDVRAGTYFNMVGIMENFLFYLVIISLLPILWFAIKSRSDHS